MKKTSGVSEADQNHFVSWLRLCPDNRISGGKVISKT